MVIAKNLRCSRNSLLDDYQGEFTMAVCQACGSKAGFGKKMCTECTVKEEARQALERAESARQAEGHRMELAQQAAEKERKALEERQRRLDAFVEGRLAALTNLIESGVTPFLYDTFIIDSQSYFRESHNPGAWSFKTAVDPVGAPTDITYLQNLGWLGWEVVATVPVTYGSTLYNTVGGNTVYAAAYGGLVVGAQVLLRLPLTREFIALHHEEIVQKLANEFVD